MEISIILFGDTHAALPWDGEEPGQGMQQPGDGAAQLLGGRERPGPYRALVPDGTDVAAALCHNRCVFAERPKDSPGCASGWHMGPFNFLKGSRGRAHCTCSELILPVPSLLMDSLCWGSRHTFHFFPSLWDNILGWSCIDPGEDHTNLTWSLQELDFPSLPAAAAG